MVGKKFEYKNILGLKFFWSNRGWIKIWFKNTIALRRPAKLGCSQVSSTLIFTIVLVGLGNTPKPGNRLDRPGIHHIQVWKNISIP